MPDTKQHRRLPDRQTSHRPPDGKDNRHKRIREYFQLGGLIVGLLVGYSLRDFFGLRSPVGMYGFAVVCGIAGAFLMSTLYVYIFGKPAADAKTAKGDAQESGGGGESYFRTLRETAESIVIALILAFLFRAFEAEAFVIPTGSMAPTLMGRHKDLDCPISGVDYRTGASVENEDNGAARKLVLATHDPYYRYQTRVEYDRRHNQWDVRNPKLRSFNGDRIIVSKFAYEFSDPQRWDVIVFKYPWNPKQNYIKRLVGLPEETIWIRHGDILLADQLFWADKGVTEALDRGQVDNRLRSLFKQHEVELPDGVSVGKSERPLAQAPRPDAEWQIRHPEMDEVFFVRNWSGKEKVEVLAARIARKPPRKLRAMLQRVDDTRYIPQELIDAKWPTRWQPWQAPDASGDNPWKLLDGGRSFQVTATEGKPQKQPIGWLRYRHMMPNWEDWHKILGETVIPDPSGETPPDTGPPDERPGQLITDYYAYNDEFSPLPLSSFNSSAADPNLETGIRNPATGYPDPRLAAMHWARLAGMHWVGDLAVEADVTVESSQGFLWLQLIEGGHTYRCRIDVSSGKATVSIDDGKVPFTCNGAVRGAKELTADTKISRPGSYHVRFANCDDQLLLWVNNSVRPFRAGEKGPVVEATYANDVDRHPTYRKEEPGDLLPVGIGSQGASLHVDRLRVFRDIYYIATQSGDPLTDYSEYAPAVEVQRIFRSPDEWSTTKLFTARRTVEFAMEADQFFPMGDNSPASKDGRLWGNGRPGQHFVERRYLTGKALFIYWPHSWDRPIPFFPNFRRMGFVR
jgi:signal peptidase I